jgi:hypothetical protein
MLYCCFTAASLQMFNHLLEKKMTIEWEYGPVKCRKLFLQGVDVPFGICV